MMEPACNLSTPEVEAGGSKVKSHFWMHSEFEERLDYMKPFLNTKANNSNLTETRKFQKDFLLIFMHHLI